MNISNEKAEYLNVCSKIFESSGNSVDFLGKRNIWIARRLDNPTFLLAKYLIYQAIAKTSANQLSIAAYDPILSGVFAPFYKLSTGENRIIELIRDEEEFNRLLNNLRYEVQSVQNVIQGRANSLIEFREKEQKPIESYKLVVLCMNMRTVLEKRYEFFFNLLNRGPAAGISFLIISPETFEEGECPRTIHDLDPNMAILKPGNVTDNKGTVEIVKGNGASQLTVTYGIPTPLLLIKFCESVEKMNLKSPLDTIEFNTLHNIDNFKDNWKYGSNSYNSSAEGVTFCIGEYGVEKMKITLGDEKNQLHNAVITGAVGQGKSNLISTIINSICYNYSPYEVNLYLLDFKEGVTFKAFANIGKQDYLPHAKAIGLESDVSFGKAVLEFLFEEYQRRMQIFKNEDVKSMRDYRKKYPNDIMPRIIVIIDEFQMMFGDDTVQSEEIADLLEKSVRLFRAAGINFILASQTIGGNMALAAKKDNIFSQVPIRIALKNSLSESYEILGLNNPAAAYLRPREAIVNLDYGEITQNRKARIAFANEEYLSDMRKEMWENATDETDSLRDSVIYPPYVFESERSASIADTIRDINYIKQKRAETKYSEPVAIIGEKISIDNEKVEISMPDEEGRNIAIFGSPNEGANHAVGMIQSIAISLAAQSSANDRFIFCDFSLKDTDFKTAYPDFADIMENTLGKKIEEFSKDSFECMISKLLESPDLTGKTYIFGICVDRFKATEEVGFDTPIGKLVKEGPSKGIHFIGWWIKESSFEKQVTGGMGNSDSFNTMIFLRTNENIVQHLLGPQARWTSQKNRALISDSVEFPKEFVFVPYVPVTNDDAAVFNNLQEEII